MKSGIFKPMAAYNNGFGGHQNNRCHAFRTSADICLNPVKKTIHQSCGFQYAQQEI
jgi:hypothetical protein